MAASTIIPLELYLQSSYEPDAEYVDGEIEERPMGEFDHSSWQHALDMWFGMHEIEWNIRTRTELRIRVSETNYRVPDVTVLDRSNPIEQIITHPPIAVFEIMSPEDRMPRILRKLSDYAEMGIGTIVVIDPQTDKVWSYRNGGLSLDVPESLPGSSCTIDWSKVREYLG